MGGESDRKPKPSAGRPTRAQAEALTVRIIDTAIDVFAEAGFAAATVDEIAGRCQTTPRSIFRRFATKDELLVASVGRFAIQLDSFRHESVPDKDALSALQDLLRFFLTIAVSPALRSFHIICINEARRIPNLSEALATTTIEWELELSRCFDQAQAEGFFLAHNPKTLAIVSLASMLSYPLILTEMDVKKLVRQPDVDEHFHHISNFLMSIR